MSKPVDLQVLLPHEEITIGGESIVIKPFAFGKLPQVIKNAGTIIGVFSSLPSTVFDEKGELDVSNPATAIILIQHLADSSDVLIEIACLGTGKSREWIEALDPYEGVLLLMKVWEVNKDFFMQRLAPLLQQFQKQKEGQPETKK